LFDRNQGIVEESWLRPDVREGRRDSSDEVPCYRA